MPVPKTVWTAEDGTDFDTEKEAADYEMRCRMKKDIPLAIRYAQHMRRIGGRKETPYSDSTIASIGNALVLLRGCLGDKMLAALVVGGLEPDDRRSMQTMLNPPKPAKMEDGTEENDDDD